MLRKEFERITKIADRLAAASPNGTVNVDELARVAGLTDGQAQEYVTILVTKEGGWVPESVAPPDRKRRPL